MKRSIVLSLKWAQEIGPMARRAEAAGLHRVWTTEYNSYDAMVRAALIAAVTDRIKIGTGITYAFSRKPIALAAATADVQAASEGRFALGIGMGTKGMRTKWYDIDWDRPASRYEELVRLLRAAYSATDGLHFDGEFQTINIPGYALTEIAEYEPVEIWGAGVNKNMLSAAARSSDGVAVHPIAISEAYWQEAIEGAVAQGLHEDGSRARIAAWVLASVQDDEEEARLQARRNLAFYFSTPSYQNAAVGASWESAASAILEMGRVSGTGDLDKLAALVTDEMLDELTISGTPAQVRDRMDDMEKRLADRGVEEMVFQLAARGADREDAVRSCSAIIECASTERAHG